MSRTTPIGLDITKLVFQVHGADKTGKVVLQQKLRRGDGLSGPTYFIPSGKMLSLFDHSAITARTRCRPLRIASSAFACDRID
jgi:hypothetical protein